MTGPKTDLKNALQMMVCYEKESHLQLKVLAAELDTTIQGLHEEL